MSEKSHWETVYNSKQPHEVSWTQDVPQTSLDFINGFGLSKSDPIIDIGGGDSNLVDYLLDQGYEDISVLDISESALDRAKTRLGETAGKVKWIVSDITEFKPERKYRIWHDRATFHFLTSVQQVDSYLDIVRDGISGYLVIGTFSENGPKKCSGLEIRQYSEQELQKTFQNGFSKIKCINEDHRTPFNTLQNFTFCSFRVKTDLV